MAPCTNKVDHEETVNIPWKKEESFSLKLKSYDTLGIADSHGRSKEFLNEIAKTVERMSINLLIVLVYVRVCKTI